MFSRSVIDESRSIIVVFKVMLQLMVSFTIIIYDHHILIVQATGANVLKEAN
jgi:hypothetical protein